MLIGFLINFYAHGDFRILYEEIDYVNEGKNADRFRRDFRNIKWVRVPVCFLWKDCWFFFLITICIFKLVLFQHFLWNSLPYVVAEMKVEKERNITMQFFGVFPIFCFLLLRVISLVLIKLVNAWKTLS